MPKPVALTPNLIFCLSQCVKGLGRPTHAAITNIAASLGASIQPEWSANKEQRMRDLLHTIRNDQPTKSHDAVKAVVDRLALGGHLDASHADCFIGAALLTELESHLSNAGWRAGDHGLEPNEPGFLKDAPTSRQGIQQHLVRLQRSSEDAAALLGGAKELLESAAKHVLLELDAGDPPFSFPDLMRAARGALVLTPAGLEGEGATAQNLTEVYDGLWQVAGAVNKLRNKHGTGHGRVELPPFDAAVARSVAEAGCLLVRVMLARLDEELARRTSMALKLSSPVICNAELGEAPHDSMSATHRHVFFDAGPYLECACGQLGRTVFGPDGEEGVEYF